LRKKREDQKEDICFGGGAQGENALTPPIAEKEKKG